MNKYKKTVILTCVLITSFAVAACGQAKEDETVNKEESAVNEQGNGEQEEMNTETVGDITGEYVYPVDDSTLSIMAAEDGSYSAELGLFRLTSIDDFTGKYENGVLTMTGTDAAGNPITAEVTFSKEQATFTFTVSTWKYLENGTQYVFHKESGNRHTEDADDKAGESIQDEIAKVEAKSCEYENADWGSMGQQEMNQLTA